MPWKSFERAHFFGISFVCGKRSSSWNTDCCVKISKKACNVMKHFLTSFFCLLKNFPQTSHFIFPALNPTADTFFPKKRKISRQQKGDFVFFFSRLRPFFFSFVSAFSVDKIRKKEESFGEKIAYIVLLLVYSVFA